MTTRRCAECSHSNTYHRTTDGDCAVCDDAAQLGTYAPCATVSDESWTDDDTAELAAAMRDAAWTRADRWSEALTGGAVQRRHYPARTYAAELDTWRADLIPLAVRHSTGRGARNAADDDGLTD